MKDSNEKIIINISILEKSIKSLYIIKYIFSFIDETKKFSIVNYNKNLQKILNIDIEYYKIISGKYKIYEKDGMGKEFILGTNILIFEGEYKTGKRNGKGKEYYENGNLKFEGEYLNDVKNGKGKEYKIDGELIFEGEYLNGKRWNGKGKEYSLVHGLKFEGEYVNGKKKL